MYCSNCRKHVVVNAKSQDPSTFLKNHQSQCTATSPRKRVVAEEPVSLDEFVERIGESREIEAADRDEEGDEWQDVAEDLDGAIFEPRGSTAEDIQLLDREESPVCLNAQRHLLGNVS